MRRKKEQREGGKKEGKERREEERRETSYAVFLRCPGWSGTTYHVNQIGLRFAIVLLLQSFEC